MRYGINPAFSRCQLCHTEPTQCIWAPPGLFVSFEFAFGTTTDMNLARSLPASSNINLDNSSPSSANAAIFLERDAINALLKLV